MTLATLHLQQTRELPPSRAALWLLPCSLCVVVGSALAAPVLRRRPPGMGIVLGLTGIAASVALLLVLPAAEALLPLGVAIAGLGLSSVAANTVGTDVPAALQGTASGALNTAAQLGTALGVAALLLLAGATDNSNLPVSGATAGWAAAAILAGVAAWRRGSSPATRLAGPLARPCPLPDGAA